MLRNKGYFDLYARQAPPPPSNLDTPQKIDSMDVSDDFKPKKKIFFFWYKKFFFGLVKFFEKFQKSKIFIIGVRALIFGPSR